MSVPPGVPSADTIHRLDLLSKVINTGGVPLMLVFLVAAHTGWIRSPLGDRVTANTVAIERIEGLLTKHERFADGAVTELTNELKHFTASQERMIQLIKIINCGTIPDSSVRDRCMHQ